MHTTNTHKILALAEHAARKGHDADRIERETRDYIAKTLGDGTHDHNTLAFFMRGMRAAITNNTKEQ